MPNRITNSHPSHTPRLALGDGSNEAWAGIPIDGSEGPLWGRERSPGSDSKRHRNTRQLSQQFHRAEPFAGRLPYQARRDRIALSCEPLRRHMHFRGSLVPGSPAEGRSRFSSPRSRSLGMLRPHAGVLHSRVAVAPQRRPKPSTKAQQENRNHSALIFRKRLSGRRRARVRRVGCNRLGRPFSVAGFGGRF